MSLSKHVRDSIDEFDVTDYGEWHFFLTLSKVFIGLAMFSLFEQTVFMHGQPMEVRMFWTVAFVLVLYDWYRPNTPWGRE